MTPATATSPATPLRQRLRLGTLPAWLVLGLGLAVTAWAGWRTWKEADQRDRERFDVHVHVTRQMFDSETEKYEQAINGIREWMGWLQFPSLEEWDNRLDRLDLPVTFPALARLGYAPITAAARRWEGRIPEHWHAVFPEGFGTNINDRLAYETKLRDWKEWAVDLPLMQAPGEGDVYAAAYHTGTMRTTGRILFRHAAGPVQAGFRAHFAVFAEGLLPGPSSVPDHLPDRHLVRGRQRMNATVGTVIAEVAIEPLLKQINLNPEIELELYAGPVAEENRLNRLDQPAFAPTAAYRAGLHHDLSLPWYGSRWTLSFRPTQAFHDRSSHSRTIGVALTGVLLTVAVAGLLWVEGRGRHRAETLGEELARARDELRVVQATREQLQRNLHDAVLQRLYAAALHARQTWQATVRGEPVPADELATQVSELDEAMTELRTFLGAATQRLPEPGEQAAALRGLAQAFARQTGVAVRVVADATALAGLPATAGEHLLPLVREGLSNAWRHGRATQVTVALADSAAGLALRLTDNGCGFDPAAPRNGGHGLKNLAERAEQCGGTFRVESRPGGPTSLAVTWQGGRRVE